MLTWALITLGVLVLVAVGIVRLVRGLGQGGRTESTGDKRPEEILRRRYASGDIDEEEYLQRRAGLSGE